MSLISENKGIIINRFKMLKSEGTAMTEAVATAGAEVPAVAGLYAENWTPWEETGELINAKSLRLYKGCGYQARVAVWARADQAPDVATNEWAVRPIPDKYGIFPAIINMDVSIGMKVRGADGLVYECYANPITSLQREPKDVPASFVVCEGV